MHEAVLEITAIAYYMHHNWGYLVLDRTSSDGQLAHPSPAVKDSRRSFQPPIPAYPARHHGSGKR